MTNAGITKITRTAVTRARCHHEIGARSSNWTHSDGLKWPRQKMGMSDVGLQWPHPQTR